MFWKKKAKSAEMEPFIEPRQRHYAFAHSCMRLFCDKDPVRFVAVMGSDKRQEFVAEMWNLVCENCEPDPSTTLRAEDITVTSGLVENYPSILVRMPKPVGVTEAHMVCIVLMSPLVNGQLPETATYRYFTLELAWAKKGQTATVLGEWKESGHLNHGAGPKPSPEAFFEAVSLKLASG